jgi:hypothetical protein
VTSEEARRIEVRVPPQPGGANNSPRSSIGWRLARRIIRVLRHNAWQTRRRLQKTIRKIRKRLPNSAEKKSAGQYRKTFQVPRGAIDYVALSESGYILIKGWVNDEGQEHGQLTLTSSPLSSASISAIVSPKSILRHHRSDVAELFGKSGHDFGFVIFDKLSAKFRSRKDVILRIASCKYRATIRPEIMSDRRMLPLAVDAIGSRRSDVGWEVSLARFLAGPAGRNLKLLNEAVVAESTRDYYVEFFGSRTPSPFTFITTLPGTPDALRFQAAEFRHCGFEVPEWIYVCTAPEHAKAVLRTGKLLWELGEIPKLTLILMRDDVAPGTAFNIAVEHATSDQINLIGPQLYPMSTHTKMLSETLAAPIPASTMQGGLLFYDDATLMHAGLHFDPEVFIRHSWVDKTQITENGRVTLACVEHLEKGMPFLERAWSKPRTVPAVDGGFMRFTRAAFERAYGFCGNFVSGHWEDVDFCLRWSESVGPVQVNPGIRLLHLDAHGSARSETSAAWHIDRCLFSEKHRGFWEHSRCRSH